MASFIYSVSPGMLRSLGIILVEMKANHENIDDTISMWLTAATFTLILSMGKFKHLQNKEDLLPVATLTIMLYVPF